MKQLPEVARAIVERARDAHDPSEAQVQNMLSKLHTQLGYTVPPTQPGAPEGVTTAAVDRARGLLHAKLLKLVLSLAAVGGIAALIAPQIWGPEPARPSVAAVEVPGAVGAVSAAQQADALEPTNRADDTSTVALGSGAPSTGDAAKRSAGSDADAGSRAAGEGSAAERGARARRAAARDGAGSARSAPSSDAAAARAVSGLARGVADRGAASTDSAAALVGDIGAPARDPAGVSSRAATQVQSGVLSTSSEAVAETRGATELGASRRSAAAPAEKVLLSDDVMPLQTARKRAQEKARAASDADELGLIDRAASLLRDGEPEDALQLLQEHGRKFPGSQLKLERRGLGVLARCGAGDIEQGRRERDEFLRDAGKAPIAARVLRACPETQP